MTNTSAAFDLTTAPYATLLQAIKNRAQLFVCADSFTAFYRWSDVPAATAGAVDEAATSATDVAGATLAGVAYAAQRPDQPESVPQDTVTFVAKSPGGATKVRVWWGG